MKEYFDILQQEEEFWSVKSRYNWLIQGDKNTKFFHTSALIRRKRNRIACLKDSQGYWVHNEEDVSVLIRVGFKDLFSSSAFNAPRSVWEISSWPRCLALVDMVHLITNLSIQEVKKGMWSLKPFKAPGLDGLHDGFFQFY